MTETYPAEIDALIQELPGKIYSADQQCKHALSLDSYACRVSCILHLTLKEAGYT